MSQATRSERAVLSKYEADLVARSHFPKAYELGFQELIDLNKRLRDAQDKERTFHRQLRRQSKGTAESRGGSFPGEADRPSRRKQVFGAAIKRLNGEISRRHQLKAREDLQSAARKALRLKRQAGDARRPETGPTADDGMRPVTSERRKTRVHPGVVGRVSQRTKAAQARKDNRAG
ncbi:hypothetical protein ACFSCV_11105 [Methylopila henanensis]|uniref:Uncharacterized protein n=1 Tax=Methylopila henanensis TaxID=873516 RepID=A0ABW4K5X9_9HYPH